MIVLFYSVVGLMIGVVALGGSYLLWHQMETRRVAEIEDAPLQSGVATVETMRGSVSRAALNHARVQLGFRINGRLALADTTDETRYAYVHIGDRMQVQYRVGKSGEIYIEDWQPAPH
jgi:hypothetical protein